MLQELFKLQKLRFILSKWTRTYYESLFYFSFQFIYKKIILNKYNLDKCKYKNHLHLSINCQNKKLHST